MTPRELLDQALLQGQKLDELVTRAHNAQAALRDAKDRVFYSIQDSFTFQQGQNVVQNLTFNVPQSDDFEAIRLSFYPFVRRINVDTPAPNTTNDLVFRPTLWVFQFLTADTVKYSVDALVELTTATPDGKTRAYQNAAFFVSQTFSGYTSQIQNSGWGLQTFDRSESPSALVFDPCWRLAKGSTVTARMTPLFSGERATAFEDGLVNEYQIRGVLEGFKRAR